LSRVLKNKHQTVSHGARRFGTRSPPAADEQFQSQHTAGSWSDVPFFNILLELNHNSSGVSRQKPCFAQGARLSLLLGTGSITAHADTLHEYEKPDTHPGMISLCGVRNNSGRVRLNQACTLKQNQKFR